MPCFEDMFGESKGKPVQYKGKTLVLLDTMDVQDEQHLCLAFESVRSDWRQGVRLELDGIFEVNAQHIRKGFVLWYDTAPKEVKFLARPKKGGLDVWNVWDVGNGVTHSWHNGAAMIVEEIEGGRRYHCNDGYPDDDFDDLVFTISKVTD